MTREQTFGTAEFAGDLADSTMAVDQPTLTPEALTSLLTITVPRGPVSVKGLASEVRYWSKPGSSEVTRIYGRLVLAEASIRFELQPHAAIREGEPVVLHGTLRVKQADGFRTTHEVSLIGDVVGRWMPRDDVDAELSVPLVREGPRLPLEAALSTHGPQAFAFLATDTAWGDLNQAARALLWLAQCRRVTTNFMQPDRFVADVKTLCEDPTVKMLVVARGGGEGLSLVGDSTQVADALLKSGRAFYSALGHETNVLLLDKHADQAFATPSVLGQALVEASRLIDRERMRTQREQALQEAHNKLLHEHDAVTKRLAELTSAAATMPPAPQERTAGGPTALPGRYVLWIGLLAVVAFLVGRCSG
ncbi:hypothetical protein M6G53_20430 [Serratia nevei]|uniref:exodeoxyribonuclease VII large subunit n=1 Tax=Serratia nevei TaxID=2703794 RepID=UPI00209E03BE|nr:exodeoxyribonuclease VII large subunit [Serratia nevei]MCP1107741.1 hypothetical protein [Serratia nevei]